MTALPDTRLLSQMSIPGTHDTCALLGGDVIECQTMPLMDQLNAGIRFIDIRCRHIGNIFAIHHDRIYQGIEFGGGVRDVCLRFLEMHPGECIIMSVKEEYQPANNTRSFEATFDGYLEGNRDRWYLGNTVPALGDVRGKIVLFRRFSAKATVLGIDASQWPDNATFAINNAAHLKVQDDYVVPTVSAIPKKWDKIKTLPDEAGSATDDRWYVNFSSGTSGTAGAYPYVVAKGSPGITGENDHLHGYLSTPPVGKEGTILMDFPEYPDNLLITQITGLNERE